MVNLKKNSLHDVTIEDYSAEGLGVARIDGMVVFVKNAVRGEQCTVKLTKVLKNTCYAIINSINQPSPWRIEPECDYFRLCGGCDFCHLTYDEECKHKKRRVDDAFKRIGGLCLTTERFNSGDKTVHYRNKAQFFVSENKIGFYRAGSHDVIDCEECLIQDKRSLQCREAVRLWMKTYSIPSYDEKKRTGIVRYIQVRTCAGGTLVTIVSAKSKLPHEEKLVKELISHCDDICGVVVNFNDAPGNVILGKEDRIIYGEGYVFDKMCGMEFRISPHSFYQINRAQAEKAYAKACDYLQLRGDECIVDLYCGIGTIGLSIAPKVKKMIGIEIVPQAVEDAKNNAKINNIDNAEFICSDAGKAAKMLAERGEKPDAIIVDPPRKGLSEDVINAITHMSPEKIVYISCNPATMARDLKKMVAAGYSAERAEAYDFFPRCAHVETVCLLVRRNGLHIDIDVDVEEMLQEKRGQAT